MVSKKDKFKKDKSIKDIFVKLHPDSLVELVEDMTNQGLTEDQIALEIKKIEKDILDDYLAKIESGEIDTTVGDNHCGDPSCPACNGVIYH